MPSIENMEATRARLDIHAAEAGVKPPVHLLADDGAPSDEVFAYCDRHNLTLDWVYCGDKRKLRRPSEPMSRQQMQDLVSEIQRLIGAAIATWDSDDAVSILEMAQKRTRSLNLALDCINATEGEAA